MNNPWEKRLDPSRPKRHLHTLHTPLGERTVYDSIAYCNRCGCCSQSCPSYRFTGEEALSPRGRNQLARLILEEKLSAKQNPALVYEAVASCTFCGRCTAACAGKIPTAEHMLELRRALDLKLLPGLLQTILTWRETAPGRFRRWVLFAHFGRNLGLLKIARFLRLTRLPFLRWTNHADDILPRRVKPLEKQLKKSGFVNAPKPELIYLPSLEADFLNPQIGSDTLKLLCKKKVTVWHNRSSGLFTYLYGDLRQSRKTARQLLARYVKTGGGRLPLVTDSAEVYTFLCMYPQLFADNRFWQKRAQTLVNNLKFIADYFPKKLPAPEMFGRVKLEHTNLFDCESPLFEKAAKILKTHFKKNFVQYSYNELAAPPSGCGFVKSATAGAVFFAKVQDTARTQTGTVFFLSGLSAMELDFYLKKYYPGARALHFTRLNG